MQIFDAVLLRDPSVVWGNLVKLGIGWVGIAYNIVMMIQVCVVGKFAICVCILHCPLQ